MTAAPGPQQPDEGCVAVLHRPYGTWHCTRPRGHDGDHEATNGCDCGECFHEVYESWPAAPSAQPDDPIPPCTCGHREPSHRGWGKGSCEALRCACGKFTPAQPVRDTGEGRR